MRSVATPCRVVITGLGVVAPNGIGKEAFWDACISGHSGIRRVTRFDASPLPSQIAGEVDQFDPLQFGLTIDESQSLERGAQFALAAAQLALQDAGLTDALDEQECDHTGVYMGSAMACVEEGEKLWVQLTQSGTQAITMDRLAAYPASLLMTHSSAMSIAAHHHLHGPATVISTGCSAGADAIGQAFWTI